MEVGSGWIYTIDIELEIELVKEIVYDNVGNYDISMKANIMIILKVGAANSYHNISNRLVGTIVI